MKPSKNSPRGRKPRASRSGRQTPRSTRTGARKSALEPVTTRTTERTSRTAVFGTLLAGVVLSVGAFATAYGLQAQRIQQSFSDRLGHYASAIDRALEREVAVLEGTASLLQSLGRVHRDDLQRLLGGMTAERRPLLAIDWAPLVSESAIKAWRTGLLGSVPEFAPRPEAAARGSLEDLRLPSDTGSPGSSGGPGSPTPGAPATATTVAGSDLGGGTGEALDAENDLEEDDSGLAAGADPTAGVGGDGVPSANNPTAPTAPPSELQARPAREIPRNDGTGQAHFPLHLGTAADVSIEGLELAPGTDITTQPSLAKATGMARKLRRSAITEPMKLTGKLAGAVGLSVLAIVTPVKADQATFGTSSALGEGLAGLIVAMVDVEELLSDVAPDPDAAAGTILLRDEADGGGAILWQRPSEAPAPDSARWRLHQAVRPFLGAQTYRSSTSILAEQRRWILEGEPTPRFLAAHLGVGPWMILGIGLALTLLATSMVRRDRQRSAENKRFKEQLARTERETMKRVGRLNDQLEREQMDRQRSVDDLFHEKQQFRLMFNAVPAMIWYKDTKNRFLLVNEAAAEWMGKSVSEIEGKPCAEIFPDQAYEYYRDDLEIVQSRKPKLGVEEQYTTEDGTARFIRTDKLPEYDSMGRVVGILIFAQDITREHEKTEEVRVLAKTLEDRVRVRTRELQTSNDELQQFAASVSHDLRAPLRGIGGFSQMVLAEHSGQLDEEAKDLLQRVIDASRRMGQLIDELLKLTRLSRADITKERVDLTAMARELASECQLREPERNVEFKIQDTPLAEGDPVLLRSVLQNLIENAWKFSKHSNPARIEFGARLEAGSPVVYYVEDNGVGFDPKTSENLFHPFYRLHGPAEFEGSGIGLSSAQVIVRRHGGSIWADAEPDQGAAFFFRLEADKDEDYGRADHSIGGGQPGRRSSDGAGAGEERSSAQG